MDSRQTCYCFKRFSPLCSLRTKNCRSRSERECTSLYLEIVSGVFKKHFTNIRFNPKPVIRILHIILRPGYSFPYSCFSIGVDKRSWNAFQCAGKVVTFYDIPFISRLWHLVFSQVGSSKCHSFEWLIYFLEFLHSVFDRHRPWIEQKRLFSFGCCLIRSVTIQQGKRK